MLLLLFRLRHASCRILVPQAGNEPRPQQRKQQIVTPGPPGNCPPTLRSLSDIPAFPGEISEGTQFFRCHPQSTSIYCRLWQTFCVSRYPGPRGNTWESSAYSEPGSDTVEGTGEEKTQAEVLGTQAFTALRLVPRGPGLRIPIRFQQTAAGEGLDGAHLESQAPPILTKMPKFTQQGSTSDIQG